MIYMDNAATTMRKPKEVAEAVMHAMNSMGNAGRGANEASLSAARVIYDTRELLAITTMLEHNSVLRPLYEMEERGGELAL